MTGKNVGVIIDSGVGAIHPEFIADDGTVRKRFDFGWSLFYDNNHTYTKIIDEGAVLPHLVGGLIHPTDPMLSNHWGTISSISIHCWT